jgi:hypothetical protein
MDQSRATLIGKEPRIRIEHRCLMGGEDSGTMQRLQRCDGDHVFVPMDVVANIVESSGGGTA